MEENQPADLPHEVAVIGAGLAGIACACTLEQGGRRATIFEKSRSYGGRCSTRLWRECVVDHGAQYFTAEDPAFLSAIQNACREDLATIDKPILDPAGLPLPSKNRARHYHRKGNNRLARALAGDFDIRREHTLERLTKMPRGWQLDFAEGSTVHAAHVVLTCPWPQAATLLGLPTVSHFQPCLTGLFAYKGIEPGNSGSCYARQGNKDGVLAWSACENHKAGRIPDGFTVFVVQSGPEFSRNCLEAPHDDWLSLQRAELEATWDLPPDTFLEWFGHRWRFARNLQPVPAVELPQGIHIAGDSVVSSRVEDAWLSGRDCAQKILLSASGLQPQC